MRLKNELLPHQKEAVDKLIGIKVGALFMEQGTGKTITALEIARIRYEKKKIDAVIWLCPCSAKENIKTEIIKQCPDEMLDIFTICGIETLSTSIRAISYLISASERKRCFLVIDESLLVKNSRAYRTENILRIAEKCPYRMILNGTPISRNEADLYAQFYFLDWRILGYRSYWSFAANHLEYDEYGKLRNVLNTDYLAEKIGPYTFQITKEQCMKLPKKHYETSYFSITEEQLQEYTEVASRLMFEVNEWKPETIYRLFSGLQAVISGKRLIFNKSGTHFDAVEMFHDQMDNPRIKRVMDILTEEKTIIFCRYESEIEQLCRIIPGAVRFDGKVPQRKRDIALRRFAGDSDYLIANRNCAGFSLNLQFCHNIIYMSNDWDLGKRMQSEDRVHRLGQDHDVYITDICAENTIDEQILKCLNRKENILECIKSDISKSGDRMKALERYVYGSRYSHEVFDCNELEDKDAKGI